MIADIFGIYEFLPSNRFFALAGKDVCEENVVTVEMCENAIFLVAGYKSDQLNAVSSMTIIERLKDSNSSSNFRRCYRSF